MAIVTTAVGLGAPTQNYDAIVVHQGTAWEPFVFVSVVLPPFGWFNSFPGPASLPKWRVQVDQPYALAVPPGVVTSGPISEGGFATILQRTRNIGY